MVRCLGEIRQDRHRLDVTVPRHSRRKTVGRGCRDRRLFGVRRRIDLLSASVERGRVSELHERTRHEPIPLPDSIPGEFIRRSSRKLMPPVPWPGKPPSRRRLRFVADRVVPGLGDVVRIEWVDGVVVRRSGVTP